MRCYLFVNFQLKELVEKQDSLLKDIHAYAARNKEQALQRVLNVQMERQKKTDEEKTHGFRCTIISQFLMCIY